jgi:predicted MFS family arabinose efflux permease
MFDLTLFRNPTFVGAAVAAFGLSAGIFAMLLYLVLYLQNVLNCSALGAGLRLAIISGAILVTASITGRLTTRMPVKLLIGPGMLLVGLGLWLMAGIGASTGWTHLILGFILTGIGIGMVNPPLASTAVGVVHPRNAGVASGINSTFRQVGTATGIAGLGSIFGSAVTSRITAGVSRIPGLGATPRAVATAIKDGATSSAIAAAPSSDRLALARLATSSFVHGLNVILIVGAVLSVMVGLASLVLIRGKDFEPASGSSYAAAPSGAAAPTVR